MNCYMFIFQIVSASSGDLHSCKSKLESLFCYDKPIPEEKIEKPIGLSLSTKEIGDKAPCKDCESKGAVLCTTCSGSGLYIDSILECQGIIVKVRCLGTSPFIVPFVIMFNINLFYIKNTRFISFFVVIISLLYHV